MHSRRIVTAALVASTVVAATACSSSGAKSSAAPTTAANGSAASSAPIKVMVYATLHSSTFGFPESLDAVNAVAKSVNDAGGIAGRKIVVESCNENLDPNLAATCGRQAVTDGVVAVIGGFSFFGTNFIPAIQAAGIPYIGVLASTPTDVSSPVTFPLDGSIYTQYPAVGEGLVKGGCSKVGVVGTDDSAARAATVQLKAGVSAAGGSVSTTIYVPAAVPDLSATVAALDQSGAQCIGSVLAPADMAKLLGAVRQSTKPTLQVGGTMGTLPLQLVAGLKGAAEGTLLTSGAYAADAPQVQPFVTELHAYNASVPADAFSEDSWSGMTVFVQVAKQLQDVTAKTVLDALNSAAAINLPTYPSPISFSTPNPVKGYERVFNTKVLIYKVSNGGYTQVGNPLDVQDAILKFTQ